MYELNVGLEDITAADACTALYNQGIYGWGARVEGGTMVVQVPKLRLTDVYLVADALGEDCIAVYTPDGIGALVGPRAEEWGAFDINQFTRF